MNTKSIISALIVSIFLFGIAFSDTALFDGHIVKPAIVHADPPGVDPITGDVDPAEDPEKNTEEVQLGGSQFKLLFFDVCWPGIPCGTMFQMFLKWNNAMLFSASGIFLAVFLIGAMALAISAGRDQYVQAGKNMMKGSVIGTVIVVGAYTIYRTVIFILYGGI